MRLILCGSFIIICCAVFQYSLAESKNYKSSKADEDNSVERPSNYKGDKYRNSKHRSEVDDNNSEESYKISRSSKKKFKDEESEVPGEKEYTKYTKKANKEERSSYKQNKKSYDSKRDKVAEGSGKKYGKIFMAEEDNEEDSDEDATPTKRNGVIKNAKDSKQLLKPVDRRKQKDDSSEEEITKTKKYTSKKSMKYNKSKYEDDDDSSDEESEEKFDVKSIRKSKKVVDTPDEGTEEEEPKKKFRKKVRVRVPDSTEGGVNEKNDEDKHYRRTCYKNSKGGKGKQNCFAEDYNGSDEVDDEPVHQKRIKYSIKFAHEKQKNNPSEDDNIMKKIHRGEKRKYRYQDDDDDDSSEEHAHPKRLHFVDEDEE